MSRLLAALFALVLVTPVIAQDKHPFTFEDMMKLKRVEEPVPSPDGKWVLFAAVDVDLAANTKTPHIWIVPLSATQQTSAVNPQSPAVAHSSPMLAGVGADKTANPSSSLGMTGERILIADQDGDRPRWAPDGKRFAFISNKEGGSQVWIADFDSATGTVTAARQVTWIASEASGELWSPDGKNILFVSEVYPECDGAPEAEAGCNARKLKETEESKVKAQIFDRLLYRHWNVYKQGKRSHLFLVPAPPPSQPVSRCSPDRKRVDPACNVHAYLVVPSVYRDLTPGDFDAPPFSLGGQDDYAFSPDGQEICFTSNHDKVEATSTNNDLWIVPVNPGGTPVAPKNITADNPASDSTPLYSPDGKYIAYRAQQRPGYESDQFRLMVYDRKTGEKYHHLGAGSLWVENFVWSADSQSIYYTTEVTGTTHTIKDHFADGLHMIVGGGPNGMWSGHPHSISGVAEGYDDGLALASDGKTLLFARMSVQHPTEVETVFLPDVEEVFGADLKRATVLTHLNDPVLSRVAMSPLESFWFAGANGDKVQGFLVRPPNFDPGKKYPVKFIIHGGPQVPMGDQWSYRWNMQLFAANGYVVIFINFHGSPGYGQKFIDAINGDWGGAPFEDLMKGLDYAEQHYPFIDKDRECALGASYGGWMVNWILGHTDRFKCLVSHDSQFNTTSAWGSTEELWFPEWEFKGTPYTNRAMYDKWSPHMYATNFKTPTLVIHGQKDYRLDVSEGFQLFTTLQRLGVPSKMLYFLDEGHWVLKPQNSQLWYKTVNDWVDQWLKK